MEALYDLLVLKKTVDGKTLGDALKAVVADFARDTAIGQRLISGQYVAPTSIAAWTAHMQDHLATQALLRARRLVGTDGAWDALIAYARARGTASEKNALAFLEQELAVAYPGVDTTLISHTAIAAYGDGLKRVQAAVAVRQGVVDTLKDLAAPGGSQKVLAAYLQRRAVDLQGVLPKGEEARTLGVHLATAGMPLDPASAMKVRGVLDQATEILEKRRAQTEPLEEALKAAKPLIETPTDPRMLDQWEADLWQGFKSVTQGLDMEDLDMVAAGLLRNMPLNPRDLGSYGALAARYKDILGQRMGDIPEGLSRPLLYIERLVKSYEQALAKHGYEFVLDPVRRWKRWGVLQYAPHLADPGDLLAKGRLTGVDPVLDGPIRPTQAGSLDERMSVSMDAMKLRRIAGSIGEIQAAGQDAPRLTVDPHAVLAHYAQVDRTITATDFVFTLLRAGVIVGLKGGPGLSPEEEAAQKGLVPLFQRLVAERDMHFLLYATAQEWGAAQGARDLAVDVLSRLASARSGGTREAEGFASWVGGLPIYQQALNLEDLVIRVRATQADQGVSMLDFEALVRIEKGNGDGWADRVADQLNVLARSNGVQQKTTAEALVAYTGGDTPLTKLYVPATVAQGLSDLFEVPKIAPGLRAVKGLLDGFNRFWKTRMTIIHASHNVRNLWNHASTMMDVGPFGAMNPLTQFQAARIAWSAHFVSEFGSLEEAAKALTEGRRAGESFADFSRRKARLLSFNGNGARSLMEGGIDLGDGVQRSGTDAIRLLQDRGVITELHNTFADLDRYEEELAELMSTVTEPKWGSKAKRVLSLVEDAIFVAAPTLIAGPHAAGIMVPKRIGGKIAQFIEVQSRLVNFLANLRQNKSIDDAVAHVGKFLFNYDDLTVFQRVWLRTLIPFFTWNHKNLALQADLLFNKPLVYQRFNQFLISGGPRAWAAYAHDQEEATARETGATGPGPFVYDDPMDPATQSSLPPNVKGKVRFAVPGTQSTFIQGLGSPVEAAFDLANMYRRLLWVPGWPTEKSGSAEHLRALSIIHPLIKSFIEVALQADPYNFYYDKPISELRNGRSAMAIVEAAEKRMDWPIVGPAYGMIAELLRDTLELHKWEVIDQSRGATVEYTQADPGWNYVYGNNPYTRMLQALGAASDDHASSFGAPGDIVTSGSGAPTALPPWMRVLGLYTGISVSQDDPIQYRRAQEAAFNRGVIEEMERRGAIRATELPTVK